MVLFFLCLQPETFLSLFLSGIEFQNFTVIVVFCFVLFFVCSANSLYCSSTVDNDMKIIV